LLADNRIQYLIYFWPQKLKEETPDRFTALNKMLEEDLEQTKQEILKKEVTEEQFLQIKKWDCSLISVEKRRGRYYPQQDLASHVSGFVGGQQRGQYGLEGEYEQMLRGQSGFENYSHNPYQYVVDSNQYQTPQRGQDLYLTLDYNVQFKANQLLEQAEEDLLFDQGQIVVMEPKTGRILALATYPGYNSNKYYQFDLRRFKNPVLQELYEPGSVLKALTMAAGLEEGQVTPKTTYEDEGSVKLGGEPIYNYRKRVWGEQTMTQVLEKSINTGAIFVQQKLGGDLFLDYLKNFGLMKETGIDLAGEVSSDNELLQRGYKRDLAVASFGQGINITPLQLITAFSALANNGEMMRPYLMEERVTANGEKHVTPPKVLNKVISSPTASQITLMLKSVVEEGYGKPAQVEGIDICGKTGTAQIPRKDQSGYYGDKTIQSFIGYGPCLDPRFLILVKLDNPATVNSSQSAAPIFAQLAQYITNQYQLGS